MGVCQYCFRGYLVASFFDILYRKSMSFIKGIHYA
jgi:hypothetical protein